MSGRDRALQATCLLEAAMPSLLHERSSVGLLGWTHGERRRQFTCPHRGRGTQVTVAIVAEQFDALSMPRRFRDRAAAVRSRGIPPIEGPERRRFVEQAQIDYMDFAMLADAEVSLVDGILTLKVDLRPKDGEAPQPP